MDPFDAAWDKEKDPFDAAWDALPTKGIPESTFDTSAFSAPFNFMTQEVLPPVATTDSGIEIRPRATVEMANQIKQGLKTGTGMAMTTAGAILAPQVRAAQGAGYLARLASYGKNAIPAAAGSLAGRAGAESAQLLPETSLEDKAGQFAQDAITGFAVPAVMDTLVTAPVSAYSSMLNNDERLAREFGAVNKEFLEFGGRKPIDENVAYLKQNSPDFVEGVIKNPNIKNASGQASNRLKQVGQQIQRVYDDNAHLSAPIETALNSPARAELLAVINNPSILTPEKEAAQSALTLLDTALNDTAAAGMGKLPLPQLWETRKSFDEIINKFNDTETPVSDQYLQKARSVVKDLIDSTVAGALPAEGAGGLQQLNKLNAEYSNLYDVAKNLDIQQAKGAGKNALDSMNTMSARKLTGSFAGLTSNKARATAYSADQLVRQINSTLPQFGVVGSSLLSRNSDEILSSPSQQQSVAGLAQQKGFVLDPQEYFSAPEAVKKGIIKQLAQTAPNAFQVSPYGFRSLFDGRIDDPMERDTYMKMVKDKNLPPGKEAEIIGSLLSDKKFVPMEEAPAPTMQAPSAPAPTIEGMSSMLSGIMPEQENQPMRFAPESMKMLEKMRGASSQRDYVRSGG